jgi:hypothetical protein
MAPGIIVQHAHLPERNRALVRSDITGIIGFIPSNKWPEGATAGDFLEIVLRRKGDLWSHPDRGLFDAASRQAITGFFANGGDTAHLFGVCIEGEADLKSPATLLSSLSPLFDRLRDEEEIAILLVPSAAYMGCRIGRDGSIVADCEVLYNELLAHCREMNNRILVLDAPVGLHGEPLFRWVKSFRQQNPENRSYGAIYYPWLHFRDELFPPSGVVAGTYAGVALGKGDFGVVWPPANIPIRNVTHAEIELDWTEASELAKAHINPIVVQPGRGVIAFGARTLSIEPNFQHVNSRRVMNAIIEQIRRDSEWAIFETNNPDLWAVLQRDIRYRLEQFYSSGLLTGKGRTGDYLVRCDAETNTPELRDAGQANVEMRMRPVGTVEEVIVELRVCGEVSIGGV